MINTNQSNLQIYRNGLLQKENEDFCITPWNDVVFRIPPNQIPTSGLSGLFRKILGYFNIGKPAIEDLAIIGNIDGKEVEKRIEFS